MTTTPLQMKKPQFEGELTNPSSLHQQKNDSGPIPLLAAGNLAAQSLLQAPILGNLTVQSLLQAPILGDQGVERYITRLFETTYIRFTPSFSDYASDDYVNWESPRIHFKKNQDVSLISSKGDWLEVYGKAYRGGQASVGVTEDLDIRDSEPIGERKGWIPRRTTNLDHDPDFLNENQKVAQDLTSLLNAHILPTLGVWINGAKIQGNAYQEAYQVFSDVLDKATQQAKARADIYAALLTTVTVGPLGAFAELAMKRKSITRLLDSEAVSGLIEDALQTGIGEGIDVRQGKWFTEHIVTETHPLKYVDSIQRPFDNLERELIMHIGNAQLEITRSGKRVDRAVVLIEMYDYWSKTIARQKPSVQESDFEPMKEEFERGFWQKYILEDLTKPIIGVPTHPEEEVIGHGHTYYHPEDAVKDKLDELGITELAISGGWDKWYHATSSYWTESRTEPDPQGGKMDAYGSVWTEELAYWARKYTPDRTFD